MTLRMDFSVNNSREWINGITGIPIIAEQKSRSRRSSLVASLSRRGSVVSSPVLFTDKPSILEENISANTTNPLLPSRQNLAYWSEAESLIESFKHKSFRSRRRSTYKFLSDEPKLKSSSDEPTGSYRYLQGLFFPPKDKTEASVEIMDKMEIHSEENDLTTPERQNRTDRIAKEGEPIADKVRRTAPDDRKHGPGASARGQAGHAKALTGEFPILSI